MERRMNLPGLKTGHRHTGDVHRPGLCQYEEAEGAAEASSPANQTVLASAARPAVDLVRRGNMWVASRNRSVLEASNMNTTEPDL